MRTKRSAPTLDIEHGSFTPLVFTSTGGMGPECLRFHSRLAELIADKKGEHYSRTISWIRARTSFSLLRAALICLRAAICKNRPKVCKMKKIEKFQKNPKHSPR